MFLRNLVVHGRQARLSWGAVVGEVVGHKYGPCAVPGSFGYGPGGLEELTDTRWLRTVGGYCFTLIAADT